jgi:hypothetical protein
VTVTTGAGGPGQAGSARDFPIASALRWVTIAESVILGVAGVGLLVAPDLLTPFWPWTLTPFTARALGAVYLAAFVVTGSLALRPWWSPARIVDPMVATFTIIITALSVVGIDRLQNWPWTGVWLVVYLAAVVAAVWYLWSYRGLPPAPTARPPRPLLRSALIAQAVLLGAYGAALLVVGATATGFWPWPVDDFHARIYSAAFITPAVGAAILARTGTMLEDRTLGASQLVSGVAAIVGAIVVDADVHRVDWGLPGTWGWVAMCVGIAAVGLLLLVDHPETTP